MAVTNIELYEALKKDLSEESARLIAQVVPAASDVATKADIARLESQIRGVESQIGAVESGLKGYIDSRLLRFTLMFFVPMWIAMLGMFGVVVAKL